MLSLSPDGGPVRSTGSGNQRNGAAGVPKLLRRESCRRDEEWKRLALLLHSLPVRRGREGRQGGPGGGASAGKTGLIQSRGQQHMHA